MLKRSRVTRLIVCFLAAVLCSATANAQNGVQPNIIRMGWNQIQGVNMGYGIDLAARKVKTICIKAHQEVSPNPLLGYAWQVSPYFSSYSSKYDLVESNSLDAGGEFSYVSGTSGVEAGGDARIDYLKTLNITELSKLLKMERGYYFDPEIVNIDRVDSEGNYVGIELQPKYVEMLKEPGGLAKFESECGNGFVLGVQKAAYFYGYASEKDGYSKAYQKISGDASFYFRGHGVNVNGDADSDYEHMAELDTSEIQVKLYSSDISLGATTFEQLESAWQNFDPATAPKQAVAAIIVPYADFISNYPSASSFESPNATRLQILATVGLHLDDLKKQVTRILDYPEQYAMGLDDTRKTAYRNELKKLKAKWVAQHMEVSVAGLECFVSNQKCEVADKYTTWAKGDATELLPKLKMFDCSSARFQGGTFPKGITGNASTGLADSSLKLTLTEGDKDPGKLFRLLGTLDLKTVGKKVEANTQFFVTEWRKNRDEGPQGWKKGWKSWRTQYSDRDSQALLTLHHEDPAYDISSECTFASKPFAINSRDVRHDNFSGKASKKNKKYYWNFDRKILKDADGFVSKIVTTRDGKPSSSSTQKASRPNNSWSALYSVECQNSRKQIKDDQRVACQYRLAAFQINLVNRKDKAAQENWTNTKSKIRSYLGVTLKPGKVRNWRPITSSSSVMSLVGTSSKSKARGKKGKKSKAKTKRRFKKVRAKTVRAPSLKRLRKDLAKRIARMKRLRKAASKSPSKIGAKSNRCKSTKDCSKGQICRKGKGKKVGMCVERKKPTKPVKCRSTKDCRKGQVCRKGKGKKVGICVARKTPPKAGKCKSSKDCKKGQVCRKGKGKKVGMCVPRKTSTKAKRCRTTKQCRKGQFCKKGKGQKIGVCSTR